MVEHPKYIVSEGLEVQKEATGGEAGVGGTLGEESRGKVHVLWQFPTSTGRQLEHEEPSFAQAHLRYFAVLLQQQRRVEAGNGIAYRYKWEFVLTKKSIRIGFTSICHQSPNQSSLIQLLF